MSQERMESWPSRRVERLGIISCGYEHSQLQLEEYDLDRRAVDIAILNAQGDRAISWWPIYEDAQPGDLVIFNLATHQRVPIDGEVFRRAKRYANHPDPGLPTHPGFVDGRAEPVCGDAAFHGLALIRDAPLQRAGGLVEARVGHVVLLPEPVDMRQLQPVPADAERMLSKPDLPCSERWKRGEAWLTPDLSVWLLEELEQRAPELFGQVAWEFRADLKALRETAEALRAGTDDPGVLSAIAAPARWIEERGDSAAESSRRTERFGIWAGRIQGHDGDVVSLDLDSVQASVFPLSTELGVHHEHWLRSAIEQAAANTRDAKFAVLAVRDIFEQADIKELLAAEIRDERDDGVLRKWINAAPEDHRWEMSEAALPVGADAVQVWVLVLTDAGEPACVAESSQGCQPLVRVVARVPGCEIPWREEEDAGPPVERYGLEPYALHRLLGSLATMRESQDRLFAVADKDLNDVDPTRHREAVRSLQMRKIGDDGQNGPSAVELDRAMAHLETIHRGREAMRAGWERLADGLRQQERDARSLIRPGRDAADFVEAITAPVRLTVQRLERGCSMLEQLAARASELFAFRTSLDTFRTSLDMRNLLDQAESAKFALRVVGAVSVMIAAFALYTSAAAVPEGGDGFLFRVSTDAAAATVVAIALAMMYGGVIAYLVNRANKATSPRQDSLKWVVGAGVILLFGVVPSALRLAGASVSDELTIVSGLAGLAIAGAIGARYARVS